MATIFTLTADAIYQLDLSPAQTLIEGWRSNGAIALPTDPLRFDIQFSQEPDDPRELSEIPEVRLWFIRMDAHYPWIPIALDWEFGELSRYAAMLVPHQFSRTEGIQYNPEALEIFVMQKVFAIAAWANREGIPSRNKLKMMMKTLGYEIDDGLFDLLKV